jgi:outer membrane scaffolding protein for murein synthesis (MipA/OmpV family)
MPNLRLSYRAGGRAASLLAAALVGMPLTPARAADDWTFSAGGLMAVGPRFPGSDRSRVLVLPNIQARYKDFLVINPIEGIGLVYAVDSTLQLSTSLGFDLTRRQAKDDSRLNGLADINGTGAVRLGAKYRSNPVFAEAKLTTRLGGELKRGSIVSLEGGYSPFATRDAGVDVGLALRWMDSNYSRNFFSVSAAQSAASGLAVFNANSGMQSAGVFVSGYQRLNADWTGFARLNLNKLQGDAAKSPITRSTTQTSLLVGASYAF